jgi:hypothetical protein
MIQPDCRTAIAAQPLPHSPNVFCGAMLRDDREALQRRVEELEKLI